MPRTAARRTSRSKRLRFSLFADAEAVLQPGGLDHALVAHDLGASRFDHDRWLRRQPKLPAHGGRLLQRFFEPIAAFIEAKAGDAQLAPFVTPLARAFDALKSATAQIACVAKVDPEEAGAAASDYLHLFGLMALAFMRARSAALALPKLREGADPDGFYTAKLGTARFFMERLLPQTAGLHAAIMAGGRSMMEFNDAAL